ncbi:hypothetical protein ACFL6X_03725 [Candidatus Latescibacterota bacterium]
MAQSCDREMHGTPRTPHPHAGRGKEIGRLHADALGLFLDYDWPGNVLELRNAIEHAFISAISSKHT